MAVQEFSLVSDLLNGEAPAGNGVGPAHTTNGTGMNGHAAFNGTGLNGHSQHEESPRKFGYAASSMAERLTFTSY